MLKRIGGGSLKVNKIASNAWFRALLAAALGLIVLILSQITAETLSRAGPYQKDANLALILPDDVAAPLDAARRVTPEYTPVPAYVFDDPGSTTPGTFETQFEWRVGDPEPALLLAYFRRLDSITLNGNSVAMQNLRQPSLVGAWRPAAVLLDTDHLVDGTNTLQITDGGKSRKVLPAFSIVPAEDAQRAAFAGEFFELHLPLAVTGIMLFVAFFCAGLRWSITERLEIRCFVALLLVWSLRNAMAFDLVGDLPNPWRVFSAYWIGYILAAAFAAYCFAWARKSRLWILGSWAIAAAALLLTLVLGYESGQAAFEISYLVESWLIPGFVVAGIATAIHAEGRSGAQKMIQLVLIAGAGMALMLDALDERFDISLGFLDLQPMIYYATPRHGILLALGMLSAMIYHQMRARRLSEDLTGELNRRLDVREAELAVAHARETELVKRETLDTERQRIMRDMHDGLGSQLMSMLLAARRGKADPPKVADGLQQVVDEMRLMIDSMDSLGESLSSAFASFRNRLQPRIEDAGFAFSWNDQSGGNLPAYTPRTSLQIFRIMQEAVTNALKHSGGGTIAVSVAADADQNGGLIITVDDDGSGITLPRKRAAGGGHGLENMRARAASIGGEIEFGTSDADGGRMRLSLPPVSDCS